MTLIECLLIGIHSLIGIAEYILYVLAAFFFSWAGDVLLLAGKGHETVQDINGKPIHFDEREEISFFFEKDTL